MTESQTKSQTESQTELQTRVTRIVAVAIGALLLLPALAGMLGFRPLAIENRELAPMPEVGIADLFDPARVAALTRYAIDHLPLRDYVVAGRSRLVLHLFRDSPSKQVRVGSDGWFYLDASFKRGCEGGSDPAALAAKLRRISAIVEGSGRQFLLAIAPDKHSIYPEHLGPLENLAACAKERNARLRAELSEDSLPGAIDLWTVLLDAKGAAIVYSKSDTHWTPFGVSKLAREVVEAAEPGLWNGRSLVSLNAVRHVGDLSKLMGLSSVTTVGQVQVRRDRVKTQRVVSRESGLPGRVVFRSRRVRSRSEAVVVSPKHVFLLADSFGVLVAPMVAPYFEEVVMGQWRFAADPVAKSQLFDEMRRADVIVIQVVEHRSYFAVDDVFVSEEFLTELASALVPDSSEEEALGIPSGHR